MPQTSRVCVCVCVFTQSEESMDQRPARYRLYGVLVHVDVMNSTAFGHYVAFVRVPDGRWFLCDDDRITQVCVCVQSCMRPCFCTCQRVRI